MKIVKGCGNKHCGSEQRTVNNKPQSIAIKMSERGEKFAKTKTKR